MKKFFLPLILTCLISTLFSSASFSQYDSTIQRQPINAFGFEWKNVLFKSSAIIPRDTLKLAIRDSGAIAWVNRKLYSYNGHFWEIAGGGAIDTTALSIYVRTDSMFYQIGGIEQFIVKIKNYDSAYIDQLGIIEDDKLIGFELVRVNGGRDTTIFNFTEGGAIDTTYIYDSIAKKLNISDVPGILEPYVLKSDTSAMLDPYKESYISYRSITEGIELLRIDGTKDTIPISSSNFPTVDDTLKANRELYLDDKYLQFKTNTGNTWRLNITGLSYTGSNWSITVNDSFQEYLHGSGSTYSFLKIANNYARMYSQVSGAGNYSFVEASPTTVTIRADEAVKITSGVFEEPLDTATQRIIMIESDGTLVKVNPSEFSGGGGGGTADTVFTKFPIVVDTAGGKDTLKIKYPANSIAVNYDIDTNDVQFEKRIIKGWTISTDTIRFVATTSIPSGTPEIIYRWTQHGGVVHLWVKAYYPTAGTAVQSASINLPSDVPLPDIPSGYSGANMIFFKGVGGLYVNKDRSINDLATASAECVMRMNSDNTNIELTVKMGNTNARVVDYYFQYPTADYLIE